MSDCSIEEQCGTVPDPETETLNSLLEIVTNEELCSVVQEEIYLQNLTASASFRNFSIFKLCNPVWLTTRFASGIRSAFSKTFTLALTGKPYDVPSNEGATNKPEASGQESTVPETVAVPSSTRQMSDSNFGKIKKSKKRRRRRALSSTHVPELESRATQTENHFLQKRINSRLQNLVEFKILKMANNLLPTTKSLTRTDWSSQQQQMQHQLHQNMRNNRAQQLYPQQAEQPLQLQQHHPEQLIQLHPAQPEQLCQLPQPHPEQPVHLEEQQKPVKKQQLLFEESELFEQLTAEQEETQPLDQLTPKGLSEQLPDEQQMEEKMEEDEEEEQSLQQQEQPPESSQTQKSPRTPRSAQQQPSSQSPANTNNENRRRYPDRLNRTRSRLRIQAKTKNKPNPN